MGKQTARNDAKKARMRAQDAPAEPSPVEKEKKSPWDKKLKQLKKQVGGNAFDRITKALAQVCGPDWMSDESYANMTMDDIQQIANQVRSYL